MSNQETSNSLEQALAEITNLIKPAVVNYRSKLAVDYLLLLWGNLHIFQVDPFIESNPQGAKIIKLDSGLAIHDFGHRLSLSPGESPATYSTGKRIKATEHMVKILAERGAKEVVVFGHETLKLAAWISCGPYEIAVSNRYVSEKDLKLRDMLTPQDKLNQTQLKLMQGAQRKSDKFSEDF